MRHTEQKEILSIGEVLYDIYPDSEKIGGAPFNFLYHVYKLTGRGRFISKIGNDPLGLQFLNFLSEKNIPAHFVGIDAHHPTGTAYVTLDEQKVPAFTITPDTAYDFIEITDAIDAFAETQASLLYIGTLAQRNPRSQASIARLYSKRIKVLYDLNLRQDFYTEEIIRHSLSASHIVKMNAEELRLINEIFFHVPFDLQQVSAELIKEFHSELVCITLGEDGAVLTDGNCFTSFRQPDVIIADTVGAGDGFTSILALGFLHGWDQQTLVERASEFAAEICRVTGALLPDEAYEKYKRWF